MENLNMTNKQKFYAFIASLPKGLADEVEYRAYQNTFCDLPHVRAEDEVAWGEVLFCAEMIADDPAGFGIEL